MRGPSWTRYSVLLLVASPCSPRREQALRTSGTSYFVRTKSSPNCGAAWAEPRSLSRHHPKFSLHKTTTNPRFLPSSICVLLPFPFQQQHTATQIESINHSTLADWTRLFSPIPTLADSPCAKVTVRPGSSPPVTRHVC